MATPVWVLLYFVLWTLVILIFSVGVFRWKRIMAGNVPIKEFRADNLAFAE